MAALAHAADRQGRRRLRVHVHGLDEPGVHGLRAQGGRREPVADRSAAADAVSAPPRGHDAAGRSRRTDVATRAVASPEQGAALDREVVDHAGEGRRAREADGADRGVARAVLEGFSSSRGPRTRWPIAGLLRAGDVADEQAVELERPSR